MLKLITFLLLVATARAQFWRACTGPLANAVTPDDVQSPACSGTSCTIGRGEILRANAFFTPIRAHARLDVAVTAFVLGVGVPVS